MFPHRVVGVWGCLRVHHEVETVCPFFLCTTQQGASKTPGEWGRNPKALQVNSPVPMAAGGKQLAPHCQQWECCGKHT